MSKQLFVPHQKVKFTTNPTTYDVVVDLENSGGVSDSYHTFDELYDHRIVLFITLMKSHPRLAWYERTDDPDWIIVGMHLPTGDITYHIPRKWEDEYLQYFERFESGKGPKFDGYTSADVIDRLKNWAVDPCEDEE